MQTRAGRTRVGWAGEDIGPLLVLVDQHEALVQ